MPRDINHTLSELVEYALVKNLITDEDREYATARLMKTLGLSDFERKDVLCARPLADILSDACGYAYENGIIEEDSVVYRDLFDTELMGVLVDRPSGVNARFWELYRSSPERATDYF